MDDSQLLRYSRHILLDELGPDAQQKFAAAEVVLVGVGGLGTPAAQFLAAAGVGTLTLCDADHCRPDQSAAAGPLRDTGCGQGEVDAAAARIAAINPEVKVRRIPTRVGPSELAPLAAAADVVLDLQRQFCDASRRQSRLRGGGDATGVGRCHPLRRTDRGVRRPNPEAPCYHCLFGEGESLEEMRCATMGVFAPLVGIVGATQAGEALKLIAGAGTTLAGRLLLLDALTMQWREMRVPRDPACPVCGGRPR
jgi:adenylyltransferase/sulfurtransferase